MRIKQFVLLSSAIASALLSADELHNINQIVGDRSIGMAGAYGAVSDDPSGMVYNPAGIAFANAASMSANVNTLQWSQITYKNALQEKFDYQRSAYQVLPNFFGVVQPFGDFMVGFSSAIVDSNQEKQDQVFDNLQGIERFTVNFHNVDTIYNVGPTVARQFSQKLAIGFSLPLHYRSSEYISNQSVVFDEFSSDNLRWTNVYKKISEQGVRPKLGVLLTPIEKLSVGLTVDKTLVLNARQSRQSSQCYTNDTDIGCSAQQNPSIEKTTLKPNYPIQVRVAGAWFPNSALLVSADFIHNSAVSSTAAFPAKEATYDAAVGLEWYWSPRWALRSGAYTSMANTPELNDLATNQSAHVDRYGATVSVARFSQGSSISLGVIGLYGQGKSQLFGSIPGLLQKTTSIDVNVFFTTSYRY